VNWIQVDLGDDNHDHFVDPDERLRVAMSMQ
jgi:arylsulfatase